MQRSELLERLKEYFSDDDLKEICFSLQVVYDDLPGMGRASKARELIIYLENRKRLAELTAEFQRLRPQAFNLSSSSNEYARKSVTKLLQVFCCYDSKDQQYFDELKKHLRSLERAKLIEVDVDIKPGTVRDQAINHSLEAAQIILLLVSADFIYSDYWYDNVTQKAIARYEQGTYVVPVIIRPVSLEGTFLGHLSCLPTNAKPISIWKNKDAAFLNVIEGIKSICL